MIDWGVDCQVSCGEHASSSRLPQDDPKRPLLLQAAMSHIELAVAHLSLQRHYFQAEDKHLLSCFAKRLEEFSQMEPELTEAFRISSLPHVDEKSSAFDLEGAVRRRGGSSWQGASPYAKVDGKSWSSHPEDAAACRRLGSAWRVPSHEANVGDADNSFGHVPRVPLKRKDFDHSGNCLSLRTTTPGDKVFRADAEERAASRLFIADSILAAPPIPSIDVEPEKEEATDAVPNGTEDTEDGAEQDWLNDLMDLFDQVDSDHSGAIELSEWKRALSVTNIPVTEAEELFRTVDTQQTGSIDRVQWLHMLEGVQQGACPGLIRKFADQLADLKHKNGKIYLPPTPVRYCLVLRPHGMARRVWDLILFVLLLYIALALPFTLGFNPPHMTTLKRIDDVIDCFFLVDLVLNFRTGFFRKEILILDSRSIALHYLSTWFVLDLITCFPWEAATKGVLPNLAAAKLLKIGKIVRMCKLMRLTKLRQLFDDSDMVDALEDKLSSCSFQQGIKLGTLLVSMCFCSHWLACFMGIVGTGWSYSTAVYFVMTTLSTVGYGDVTVSKQTESHRWSAIVVMVLGSGFYGYLIGTLCNTIAARDRNQAAYHERMEEVRSWLLYHTELPRTLRRRVKRYFQKHLSQKASTDDLVIVNDLSPALSQDVSYFLIDVHVRCNVLFHNLPNSALATLMPILEKVESEPHDEICTKGDPGTSMFIITEGVANFEEGHLKVAKCPIDNREDAANDNWDITNKLTIGDSFGEEIVLGIDQFYQYTVMAKTSLKMYTIHKDSFVHAFRNMPDVREKLKRNFTANTKPDVLHRDKMKGRANLRDGAIPKAFPDTVLDLLKDVSQSVNVIKSKQEQCIAIL